MGVNVAEDSWRSSCRPIRNVISRKLDLSEVTKEFSSR